VQVHAVQRRDTKELFAMKIMDKAQILDEKMVDQVLNERYMMAQLNYPLVVNLKFAAQDQLDLFLVVDLMLGGDVRYHMKPGRPFPEDRVKFYTAQTALGINYLHTAGYIHRDIKPDNLLLDDGGNVHLTDFNLSIKSADPRRRGVVGTRSYMAPEIVSRHQYGEAVDWWSLGICIYEWLFGQVPFRGSTEEQREAIINTEPKLPTSLSKHWKSLLTGLLKKDPSKRFNFEKIKAHPLFADLDWNALEKKTADAPWKPDTTKANCDGTYDLDEQFQVKKKRYPVIEECFSPWDWKPGQQDTIPVRAPRTNRTGSAEISVSTESDDTQSEDRPGASLGDSDSEEPSVPSKASTADSIPSSDTAEQSKKPKRAKSPTIVVERAVPEVRAGSSDNGSPTSRRKALTPEEDHNPSPRRKHASVRPQARNDDPASQVPVRADSLDGGSSASSKRKHRSLPPAEEDASDEEPSAATPAAMDSPKRFRRSKNGATEANDSDDGSKKSKKRKEEREATPESGDEVSERRRSKRV
jgi:serine/threonine protein kinase